MTIHADTGIPDTPLVARRREVGRRANLAGHAAERNVAAAYHRQGYDLIEICWRGQGGEIDLIFCRGALLIFTEVKQARTIDEAISRLRPAQMRRIHAAASEYLAYAPNGQLSDVRFDLATVDRGGKMEIFENAFGHF